MSWIPLSSGVIKSSLWSEEDWVIKIFLTMLADKGPGDIYTNTAYALAHDARKTEAQVLEAWKILSGPDRLRMEDQANGGARIRKVEGGWLIINAAEYRRRMSEELKRYRNAKAQKVWRQKQAMAQGRVIPKSRPLPGEVAAVEHGVVIHEHREAERVERAGVAGAVDESAGPGGAVGVGKAGRKRRGVGGGGGRRVSEPGAGFLDDGKGQPGGDGSGSAEGSTEGRVESGEHGGGASIVEEPEPDVNRFIDEVPMEEPEEPPFFEP